MKNELHIVEEFQSSPWGQICIREAICIAREILKKKKFVYLFKKVRSFGNDGDSKIFREGWAITDNRPGYYHSIGSFDKAHQVGYRMDTLYSKEGERKVPKQLQTNYWSLWYKFELMFGEAGLRHQDGRITVDDKAMMGRLIEEWDDVLSKADGRPMITVLAEYTKDELDRIHRLSNHELDYEIRSLDMYITGEAGKTFEVNKTPILAKGMNGPVKAAKIRLGMRRDFWIRWRGVRGDILTLAKEYSVTTDKWVHSTD